MKKFVLVIIMALLVSLVYAEPFKVDLSKMTIIPEVNDLLDFDNAYPGTRNKVPFAKQWRWVAATLGDLPDNITSYNRITIKIKCFDENGVDITGGNSLAQVGMFYDMSQRNAKQELHLDGHSNLILKEANVGGSWGDVSKDNGVRVRIRRMPAGMWIQTADNSVKYIEITEVVFHNGDYKGN